MDDASALIVMQRQGQAYFARDAERLAQAITSDAQWHFAIGAGAPHGRVRTHCDERRILDTISRSHAGCRSRKSAPTSGAHLINACPLKNALRGIGSRVRDVAATPACAD